MPTGNQNLEVSRSLKEINVTTTWKTALGREALEQCVVTLGFAFALFFPVCFGSDAISAERFCAVFVVAYLSVLAGRFLNMIIGLPQNSGYLTFFTIIGGYSLASIVHLSITSFLNVGTLLALLLDFGCLITLIVLAMFNINVRAVIGTKYSKMRPLLADVGLLVLTSALVTLWTREALTSVSEAEITGIFRAWSDFLLQAAEIQNIQDAAFFGGESPYLANTAQPFYHRASYAMAAVYNSITRDGALESATYFWLPAGMILLGAGVCALGTAMSGKKAALAALLALFLLPDAAMYGLKNGYFAFHWLLQVTPGSGYALALALLALGLYIDGVRTGRFEMLVWAVGLSVASVLFRVHIALPAIGMFVLLVWIAWLSSHTRYRWASVLVFVTCVAVVIVGMEGIEFAPHMITGNRDVLLYIEAVHLATPSAYEGWWDATLAGTSVVSRALFGYPVLVLAELGVLIIILPILTLVRRRMRAYDWRIDSIPYVVLIVHSIVVFLIPTPVHGDITEWSHRSFVLVYSIFLVIEIIWLFQIVTATTFFSAYSMCISGLYFAMVAVGFLTPWKYGRNAQYGLLRDGPTACQTPISSDLFAARGYILSHSSPGDRLQASDSDPLALVVALTGKPAYVSRLPIYDKVGGAVGELATARAAENANLASISSFNELKTFGQRHGIQWYLLRESDLVNWPERIRERAAFGSGNILVFDLRTKNQ